MPRKEKRKVTDGIYILTESDVKNQLYFYREDEEPLGNVGNMPLVLYSKYLACKVEEDKLPNYYEAELLAEESDDGKCIRLTISEQNANSPVTEPQQLPKPNFFEYILGKIFGK